MLSKEKLLNFGRGGAAEGPLHLSGLAKNTLLKLKTESSAKFRGTNQRKR